MNKKLRSVGFYFRREQDSYPSHTKTIVIICVVGLLIGNLQYMVGGNIVNLISGRVICGKFQFLLLSPTA